MVQTTHGFQPAAKAEVVSIILWFRVQIPVGPPSKPFTASELSAWRWLARRAGKTNPSATCQVTVATCRHCLFQTIRTTPTPWCHRHATAGQLGDRFAHVWLAHPENQYAASDVMGDVVSRHYRRSHRCRHGRSAKPNGRKMFLQIRGAAHIDRALNFWAEGSLSFAPRLRSVHIRDCVEACTQ